MSDRTEDNHVVEVPDRETQIPIDCPGCDETFTVLLSEKIGAASCTGCGDTVEFVRPGDRRGQDSDDDKTEQTTLIPDGGTGRREVADQPALVTHCTGCGERIELDRHIKSIGDRFYAVCYDCSPLSSSEERQQQKLVTDGGTDRTGPAAGSKICSECGFVYFSEWGHDKTCSRHPRGESA